MREEKQLLLNEVKQQIESYDSFVVMRYFALSANKINEFRKQVVAIGGNVEVMRKRILIKAAQAAGIDLTLQDLSGHIGLVYAGKDPIEITKFVFKFGQENEKAIEVIGGRFEGHVCDANRVKILSELPGKDGMRSAFLGLLEAPMAQTLSVMEALLSSVMHCLNNKNKEE